MEMTPITLDHKRRAQALTNMPRCNELMLEGLAYSFRSPERGLCWDQLEAGPDLAQGAYMAPVGEEGRAIYLASGAHVVTSMDAELSRCELRDRASDLGQLDLNSGLIAVGSKQYGTAGCIEGMIMSIPPVIVALGHLTRGFNAFIQSAGYVQRPGFESGIVFIAARN